MITTGMNGDVAGVRHALHALVNPVSNEQYVKLQLEFTDQFKQPGQSILSFSTAQRTHPSGFLIGLQHLVANRSLPSPERLLASVISARELRTKWRNKMYVMEHSSEAEPSRVVPEERKPDVRRALLGFLEEGDSQVRRRARYHPADLRSPDPSSICSWRWGGWSFLGISLISLSSFSTLS